MEGKGSLTEFLLAQGLRKSEAFIAKPRFDAWMRRNKKLPKATERWSATDKRLRFCGAIQAVG